MDSGFRPVALGGDDPLTNSDDELYFRRHPGVKRALRRAIRQAMNAAEHNQSIDPLELLAEGLRRRGHLAVETVVRSRLPPPVPQLATPPPAVVTVPSVPTHYVKPANAWGPGPSPFKRHKLPAKLPTRGMWPPVSPVSPDDPNGAYRSLGKLKHYRGGDLEQPGELKKAVEARSHNGELILTYGNEVGTAWIANLVFSLRASGIEHYLVIVMSDAHCKALSRPPWMISCAWSSWDFTSCKNKGELRRLWYSRHHYMSRVIAETKLNVAVVDGDMFVQRDFYPLLKAAPLRQHNLIYSLDHGPTCGDLNVGFAYCQGCAAGGHAQWAIDEGLRRENYFCSGDPAEFGDQGRFWKESDASGATKGPHHWVEWTSARDQKLYSDVVGGSCCNAPQHRLLFPSTHKVVDNYAFMRQYGQFDQCRRMAPQKANGLQTWWHDLLSGKGPNETVAIATGQLLSGWHGTGAGELSGWSGNWIKHPPAIAHFVGGLPAGGKVHIMQGLNWWRYESDVVAHAVQEETGKKAGMALPASFFSPKTQRGLLALAGPAATLRFAERDDFIRHFMALRWWMLTVAMVLGRTAVDPQPHCDSAWVVSDDKTGNRGAGYRHKWYTPGWPWPFHHDVPGRGVGVVLGNCSYGEGRTTPSERPSDCCSAIFGDVFWTKPFETCFETAHRMVVEQALAEPGAHERAGTLDLQSLVVGGRIDAARLRVLASNLTQQVMWVVPPSDLTQLPPVHGFNKDEELAIGELVHEKCHEKYDVSKAKKRIAR